MLHTPLTIGKMVLRNRIVAEPVVSNSGQPTGAPSEQTLAVYEGYARSGAGLVVIEQHAVHPWGRNKQSQFRLYGDEEAAALAPLTKLFRDRDVPVVAQLNFSGAGASGKELLDDPTFKLVSPSGIRNPRDLIKADSVALKEAEIEEIVTAFADAARRAVTIAGYTGGVQIYACHGYLIGQFLSPLTNRREDGYGGCLAARARFLFDIVRAVKSAIGDAPLSVRLGVSDQMPGKEECGLTLSESLWVAGELARLGVDWIGVSGNHCIYGIGEDDNDTAYFAPYSKAVRDAVTQYGVKVDCAGGIRSAEKARHLLDQSVCDLVGLARPLIKNKNYLQTW